MADYGVDPYGKPTGAGQPTTGQETGCPPGQKKVNGVCQATPTAQPDQRAATQQSITGNTNQPTIQPVASQPQSPPVQTPKPQYATNQQVQSAYQQYLGRDFQNPDEGTLWQNDPNWESGIKNSAEAQQFAARGQATPPAAAVPGFNGNYQQYFESLFPNERITAADLKAKEAELAKVGIKLHASTSNDNIEIPGMGLVDVIQDAGGLNKRSWQPENAGGGGASIGQFLNPAAGTQLLSGPTSPQPEDYKVTPYGGTALPTYNPMTFSKPEEFTSAVQAPTESLIQQLLASGGSMNPAVVAQMKEGQKSSALSMQDQLRQQFLSDAASRGVSRGGATQSRLDNLDQDTIGNISRGYRDTDIAAAQTNQADKLNAVGAASAFQNQLLSQYLGQNAQTLQREQGQASENQAGFASEQAKNESEFQRYLANNQLGLTANDQAFQHWVASQGLTLNFQNAKILAEQFNKNYGLNIAQFLGQ